MRSIRSAGVLAAAALLVAGVAARADAPKPAKEVMSAAYSAAKKQHKNVLVFFDASW